MIGEHVESSLCCAPMSDVLIHLSSKICNAEAKTNILVAQQDTQLRSLLLELMYRKIIPLEEACCYCHSGIRDISNLLYSQKKSLRQHFKQKPLGPDGLPVLIVTANSIVYIILSSSDSTAGDISFARGMDEMLTEFLRGYKRSDSLQAHAPYYKSMMKLLSSNRDRSIVHWILKQVYSSTSLEHYLAIDRDTLNNSAKGKRTALQPVDTVVEKLSVKADHHINEKIIALKSSIEKDSSVLERKRKKLSKELTEDKEFDSGLKKEKLLKLECNPNPIKRQFVYYKFNQWK